MVDEFEDGILRALDLARVVDLLASFLLMLMFDHLGVGWMGKGDDTDDGLDGWRGNRRFVRA